MSVLAKSVLLDTSIWISYLRKNEDVFSEVNLLINARQVCLLGLILAELYQGCKSQKEIDVVHDLSKIFPKLEEKPDTWEQAGILSFKLRKQGKTLGLADCYIATIARQSNVLLYTQDKHFKELAQVCKLWMYRPESKK